MDSDIRNPNGPGTTTHPSQELHPTSDFTGQPKPQRFVPTDTVSNYPESWFDSAPILGSESFSKSTPVKHNIDKNTPQEENT